METVSLRPASGADIEFCFGLHRSTFYQYVTEIWGWDEDDQRAIHARNFSRNGYRLSASIVWTSAGSTSTSATRRSSFCSSSYRRPTRAAASVAG
jgi:hypothetical protein